jgi:hypothetical protein
MTRPIDRLKQFETNQIKQELSKIDKNSSKPEDLKKRIDLLEQLSNISGGTVNEK